MNPARQARRPSRWAGHGPDGHGAGPVGTPIVLLQQFMGNLDNYDPAITDALATGREVILTDHAGVGLSTGAAPQNVAGMARDAGSLIVALGLEHVDLFGFSMGGMSPSRSPSIAPNLCGD
jgi:pimeloyl-ACP methyl ester carboxylesterase